MPGIDDLQSLDQSGIDQQSIETPRLRPAGTTIEQPAAALKDILLFQEGRIERQPGRFQHNEREIGRIERIERRGDIDGREIHGVDRIVGG